MTRRRSPVIVLKAVALSGLVLALPGASWAAERARVPAPAQAAADTSVFDQLIATGSRVHMTVTNYGFYGNNFFSRAASLEYPSNRGYEHLVRGGLWIGAKAQDDVGEFNGVTTGTVDAAQGPTSPQSTEFTPGAKILLRSKLLNSPYSSRESVSELDAVSDFNDYTPKTAANNQERHRPLRVAVRHENYQWSFGLFQHCLFFHITVRNSGAVTWTSLRTVRRTVACIEVSIAVPHTSPSPWAAWPSPSENSAPGAETGRKTFVPAVRCFVSMLPPK